jgi:ATP/ADP translocase
MVFIKGIMEFSGSHYLPALCYLMAVVTCVGGLWVCVVMFQAEATSELVEEWGWLYTATISGIVILDLLIAVILCYYLKRSQRWLGR